jgi:predicted nucleotidyltransferase
MTMTSRPAIAVPEEISALVAAMCKSLHPAEIWLFGSRARGTARPDSDWDLLAVLDNNAAAELSDPVLAWRISRESNVPSTILTARRDDLEKIWGLPNTLGYDLSREGVRLIVG